MDQIEEHRVIVIVRHLVALQRLAVFTDVATGRTLFIPIQTTVIKVFRLRLTSHPECVRKNQKINLDVPNMSTTTTFSFKTQEMIDEYPLSKVYCTDKE